MMSHKRKVAFLAVVALGMATAAIAQNATEAPPDPLLGTWIVQEAEFMGKKSPPGEAGKMRLAFHKDKVTWHFDTPDGPKSFDGTYKVDSKKNPKEIDLSQPNNPKTVALGIYKIEGKTLTILMGPERPKNFEDAALAKLVLQKKKSD
jgi:uncharacterized protein (TIGR03067 family)